MLEVSLLLDKYLKPQYLGVSKKLRRWGIETVERAFLFLYELRTYCRMLHIPEFQDFQRIILDVEIHTYLEDSKFHKYSRYPQFSQIVDSVYLIYNFGKQRRLRNFRHEIKKQYHNDTLLQQDTD
jgi:hypothetical protein